MKNQFDSYTLYGSDKNTPMNCRIRFLMTDEVDPLVMERAANDTMPRFPYFSVRVELDQNQNYVLVHNNDPVVVVKESKNLPPIGSAAVNRHLLFISYSGKDVYFNINHTFGMGGSFYRWAASVLYQYVTLKYHVSLDCPNIIKPESRITEDEVWEPSLETIPDVNPFFVPKKQKSAFMLKDYLNGMLNPFQKSHSYYIFTFDQKSFMGFARDNDSSVNSLLTVLMFKMLSKVLPAETEKISGSVSACSAAALGHPMAHNFLVRQLHIYFDKKMAEMGMAELGTIARGQMVLQLDESNTAAETRSLMQYFSGIDEQTTLKDKRKYAVEQSPLRGKDAIMHTFSVSYSGYFDMGDLARYIERYHIITDGHLMLEVTALKDKIYVSFQQMIRSTRYVDALKKVLDENGIAYQVDGPFRKNMPALKLPSVKNS